MFNSRSVFGQSEAARNISTIRNIINTLSKYWNPWWLTNAWFILFILWCQKFPPSRWHSITAWHSWLSDPETRVQPERRMTGVSCVSSYQWEQPETQFTHPKSNDKNIILFFDISALKLLVVFCHLVLQQVRSSRLHSLLLPEPGNPSGWCYRFSNWSSFHIHFFCLVHSM